LVTRDPHHRDRPDRSRRPRPPGKTNEHDSVYEDVDPTSKELFRHYLFFVTQWAGVPRIANTEHSEIRWFPPEEVDFLDVAPSIKAAIHQVLPTKP